MVVLRGGFDFDKNPIITGLETTRATSDGKNSAPPVFHIRGRRRDGEAARSFARQRKRADARRLFEIAARGARRKGPRLLFMSPLPFAIFLGSALLFCLQPMVGRTLLPAFGGSAAVWSVCLAAFQALLVGGYAYAHALGSMDARRQRRLHVIFLGAAAAWAFAVALFGLAWAQGGLHAGAHPALEVLLVVVAGVGAPYLILSAGSSLLQAWASASGRGGAGGRGAYRLYAISNLGSFCGLFAYPFLMEPFVPLRTQWLGWCAGVAVYLGLVACVARRSQKEPEAMPEPRDNALDAALALREQPIVLPKILSGAAWWLVLPGLSSFTLVAVTNHLSMDVAPMPLLWAILLGAFLLSYVAGFSRAGERWLPLWRMLAPCALIACGFAAQESGGEAFAANIAAGTALVFFCGTFLHGWLYAIRPEGRRLTRFYLGVAVGGALGGAAVSFGAPAVFDGFWEYQIAIAACAAALIAFSACTWTRVWYVRVFSGVTALGAMCACMLTWTAATVAGRGVVLRERNFYGALRVSASEDLLLRGDANIFSLTNGGTLHGQQAHGADPEFEKMPTSYYGPMAGGLAVLLHEKWTGEAREKTALRDLGKLIGAKGKPMRAGAIGLGVGTMATWGRAGDEWRFYEINPLVDRVARDTRFFTYMSKSEANVRTVIGDARLMLERERVAGDAPYDVLIIDAYSGDSVPLHLATEETFRLYAERLAPGGIMAMHISNWHMDLLPLCKAAARALGMHVLGVQSPDEPYSLINGALWVFLTREPLTVDARGSGADLVDFSQVRDMRLPTDAWGSLQELISFNYTVPMLEEESE